MKEQALTRSTRSNFKSNESNTLSGDFVFLIEEKITTVCRVLQVIKELASNLTKVFTELRNNSFIFPETKRVQETSNLAGGE